VRHTLWHLSGRPLARMAMAWQWNGTYCIDREVREELEAAGLGLRCMFAGMRLCLPLWLLGCRRGWGRNRAGSEGRGRRLPTGPGPALRSAAPGPLPLPLSGCLGRPLSLLHIYICSAVIKGAGAV
jgi:hypothetical protein